MSSAPASVVGNGKLAILKNPIMQAGFAGLSIVLIGIIVWRMYVADQQFAELMVLQSQTNAVIQQHNTVIEQNTGAIRDLNRIVLDKL